MVAFTPTAWLFNWQVHERLLAAVAVPAQQAPPSIPAIESLIRSQDYDHALQLTKAALHQQPNDFRIWTLQGIVYSLKNDNRDAVKAFDRALALSPGYVPALKGKVQLLFEVLQRLIAFLI